MGGYERLWKDTKTGLYYDFKIFGDFIETNLVYNTETKLVYYSPETNEDMEMVMFLETYISQNGKRCQYINKRIIEIA